MALEDLLLQERHQNRSREPLRPDSSPSEAEPAGWRRNLQAERPPPFLHICVRTAISAQDLLELNNSKSR